MKKVILCLALMLSFAFTKAQVIDSTYRSDSIMSYPDITNRDLKQPYKIESTIIFRVDPLRIVFNTGIGDSLIFLWVENITSETDDDAIYAYYRGTIKNIPHTVGTRTTPVGLYSVGVFDSTSAYVFYIKKPHDTSDDARTLRWLGRPDSIRPRSGFTHNDAKLPW